MAIKKKTLFLALLLFGVAAVTSLLVVGAGCMQGREPDRLDEINALVAKRDRLVVKAKLLKKADLDQKETKRVDVSSKSELILALLLPANTADNLSGKYDEICQIEMAEGEDAPPIVFHIYFFGPGPALYSVGGSHHYLRTRPCVSEPEVNCIDEAVTLCGFIQAAVARDDKREAQCEKALRLSAGLDQPK
jgi:hypothetical protein